MKMVRISVQVSQLLKRQIDAERILGTSAAGLIRHALEKHF